MAVIGLQNDWGLSATGEFTKAFEALAARSPAPSCSTPARATSRRSSTKVTQAKPEAIYFAMFYEEGALILQQARQLNVAAKLYSASPFYAPKLIELAGPAAEGVLLSTTFVADSPAAHVVGFVGRLQERFDGEPNQFAAQAYDAVGIMLEAIKRVGPAATRAQIRDSLAATANYPGVTGAPPSTRPPASPTRRWPSCRSRTASSSSCTEA